MSITAPDAKDSQRVWQGRGRGRPVLAAFPVLLGDALHLVDRPRFLTASLVYLEEALANLDFPNSARHVNVSYRGPRLACDVIRIGLINSGQIADHAQFNLWHNRATTLVNNYSKEAVGHMKLATLYEAWARAQLSLGLGGWRINLENADAQIVAGEEIGERYDRPKIMVQRTRLVAAVKGVLGGDAQDVERLGDEIRALAKRGQNDRLLGQVDSILVNGTHH
jgi:hypothetical protein